MLATLLLTALAATTPPPPAPGLTLQRFESTREARLMAGDVDGDGRLSRDEFAAAHPKLADPARRFARMDTNGDGYLSKAEIDAALGRRFARLDVDHDGLLSPAERVPHRARAAQPPAG